MKGFIIYPTYRIINDQPYIALFGRLENGESFLTINKQRPYFYIKKKDLKNALKLDKFDHENTKFKSQDNEPVIKITVNLPAEVPKIRKQFEENSIACYEADIRFVYRYLIDKDIKGCIEYIKNQK